MDYKTLKILLDKYYAGNTSLEEEAKIKKLLKRENVATEIKTEKQLFELFDKKRKESNPCGIRWYYGGDYSNYFCDYYYTCCFFYIFLVGWKNSVGNLRPSILTPFLLWNAEEITKSSR